MAKNKAHAYLYDEWESLKTALREENANLHALENSQYNALYTEHDIDVFYRLRDLNIIESKNAIKIIEQKINKTKKAIKYANTIYQKCL
jgi:hypothetical protein